MNSPEIENKTAVAEETATRRDKIFCLLLNRRYNLIAIDAGFFCMSYVFNAVFFSIAADRPLESWLNRWPNFLIFLVTVIAGRFLSKVYRNVWRYPNVLPLHLRSVPSGR